MVEVRAEVSAISASVHAAWAGLGLPEPALIDCLARWQQPHRHYHSVQHLEECLHVLPHVAAAFSPDEQWALTAAVFYHDAIYDPTQPDNEAQSAALAVSVLQANGQTNRAALVESLILSTRHQALPATALEQALSDIDLAILAAAPARFAEYNQQIRAEYAFVPEALYASARRRVLEGFAARPRLYYRHGDEDAARWNLQQAVGCLK
jgi:predicted metal-dependent HD superfamily phosphohydrolase